MHHIQAKSQQSPLRTAHLQTHTHIHTQNHHTSHITHHTSHITHHTSHITHHTSQTHQTHASHTHITHHTSHITHTYYTHTSHTHITHTHYTHKYPVTQKHIPCAFSLPLLFTYLMMYDVFLGMCVCVMCV